jgi:hypothetical protein
MIKKGLTEDLSDAAGLGKKKDESTSVEKKARDFLKGLPFGK